MEFKEFDIFSYFRKNYGLGDKPSAGGVNGLMLFFGVLLIAVGIILKVGLGDDSGEIGLVLMIVLVLVGLALMLPSIISGMRDKGKADAWQAEYDHRKSTWDNEFDKFYQGKVDEMNLKQIAMLKIGITEEQLEDIQPFCVCNFILKGEQARFRIDVNGVVRANHNEITWLFFGKEQVYLYNIKFFLTTPAKEETTQEFFYKDIVSVSVATEHLSLDSKNCIEGNVKQLVDSEKLKLSVPGDKMSLVVPKTDAVASIQALKDRIRAKKSDNTPQSSKKKTATRSKKSDE